MFGDKSRSVVFCIGILRGAALACGVSSAVADALFDREVRKNHVSGDRFVQQPVTQTPWGIISAF